MVRRRDGDGIPATFVNGGLREVVEDPFGASMCLVLVGLFFAPKLYRMNLLTIGDYYRNRYGVPIEILCSILIILSYLGWVAAQITALGVVFTVLSGGEITVAWGMVIGTILVLIYVIMGGMLAVAYTDFIQMIVLVIGLSYIAWVSAGLAGGAGRFLSLRVNAICLPFYLNRTSKRGYSFICSDHDDVGFGPSAGCVPACDVG